VTERGQNELLELDALSPIVKVHRELTPPSTFHIYKYYVEHCPLSQLRLTYVKFLEFALLPSSSEWFSLY